MPTLKNKKSVGRLAQSLRKIKNKPRVEEDEADLIEFDDEELTDKALSGGDNRALSGGDNRALDDNMISIPDPVIVRNEPTNEMLRIAVIENKLRKEFKEAQAKPIEPKPKIKASDIQKMIKESIKESIKEQLAEELKQRDTIKEQRKAEKEARELERQTKAEQLKEEKRIKDEQLKEERKKQKAIDAKKERELLRQELETGIKIREEQIKNALNLQIRKVRSSALLS